MCSLLPRYCSSRPDLAGCTMSLLFSETERVCLLTSLACVLWWVKQIIFLALRFIQLTSHNFSFGLPCLFYSFPMKTSCVPFTILSQLIKNMSWISFCSCYPSHALNSLEAVLSCAFTDKSNTYSLCQVAVLPEEQAWTQKCQFSCKGTGKFKCDQG